MLKYTGKERDAETGLDYFGARYMSSAQGRFTSPDRPFYDWNPTDPQSWNLYSYVRNSPLVYTDPDGRACVSDEKGNEHDDKSGGQSCADAHKDDENTKPSAEARGKAPKVRDLSAEAYGEYVRTQSEGRRQLQRKVQDIPLSSTARTVLTHPAISNLPTDCGGGYFYYLGRELDGGAVHGFAGTIVENDSEHGRSQGALFEAGAGEGATGGLAYVATVGANGHAESSVFVFGGVGAHGVVASGGVGGIAFNSGVGLYAEGFLSGRGGGGGVYGNITSVGGCHQ